VKAAAGKPADLNLPVDRVERHLGVPPHSERRAEWLYLIEGARHWCREHVRPWVRRRQFAIAHIAGSTVLLDGGRGLHSRLLAERLRVARAQRLCVVALSAGRGIDQQIQEHWKAGRPDAAFTLYAYGSALVEELRDREAELLSYDASLNGERVLPYLSPGYSGWPLEDQANLFALIADHDDPLSAGPVELLESGGLRPSKSTLVVFGLTRRGLATQGTEQADDGS
jgi:hypothetical protein